MGPASQPLRRRRVSRTPAGTCASSQSDSRRNCGWNCGAARSRSTSIRSPPSMPGSRPSGRAERDDAGRGPRGRHRQSERGAGIRAPRAGRGRARQALQPRAVSRADRQPRAHVGRSVVRDGPCRRGAAGTARVGPARARPGRCPGSAPGSTPAPREHSLSPDACGSGSPLPWRTRTRPSSGWARPSSPQSATRARRSSGRRSADWTGTGSKEFLGVLLGSSRLRGRAACAINTACSRDPRTLRERELIGTPHNPVEPEHRRTRWNLVEPGTWWHPQNP